MCWQLFSPAPSQVLGLHLLCLWLPPALKLMHPNSPGSDWGKSGDTHCYTTRLGLSFHLGTRITWLEAEFEERKVGGGSHVLPLVLCGHHGQDRSQQGFFAGAEDGNPGV